MLTTDELLKRIETVFRKEKTEMEEHSFQPIIYQERKGGNIPFAYEFSKLCINEDVPNTSLRYENLELLLKLYARISSNPELKQYMINWMILHIEQDEKTLYSEDRRYSTHRSTSGLAVYFLFRIKEVPILEIAVKNRAKKKLSFGDILKMFQNILIYEHYLMTERGLDLIEKAINAIGPSFKIRLRDLDANLSFEEKQIRIARELINEIRTLWLKKELSEEINYEINQDKEKIQKYISKYGFTKEASEALNKIDEAYYETSEEKFNFRNNISLLKEIFDSIMTAVLDKLIKLTKEEPNKKEESEHPTETKHRFISEKLDFSEGEIKCMSALNKMLNEEKHSLISKKEKLRLTKNFTIEFLLLVFTKLSKFENTLGS